MQSGRRVRFLFTGRLIVGATGLNPSSQNSSIGFHVVVEIESKSGRTVTVAPSLQSTLEWNASFPLAVETTSCISLCVRKGPERATPRGPDGLVFETTLVVDQILPQGCGIRFTTLIFPLQDAGVSGNEGQLMLLAEVAAVNPAEGVVAGEADTQECTEMSLLEHLTAPTLDRLALAFHDCYTQSGNIEDLEHALHSCRVALVLHPAGHPCHPESLSGIILVLMARLEQPGNEAELDEVIQHSRALLDLRPVGLSDYATSLSNVADILSARFADLGNRAGMDQAVELGRGALDLLPQEHPDRCALLGDLASALLSRFCEIGGRADLDEAVDLYRAALKLSPWGYPHEFVSFNNLALTLSARFKQLSDRADADEIVELNRAALNMCPDGCPDRPDSLNNLVFSLATRFQEFDNRSDLGEAIEYYRAALAAYPYEHPDRAKLLRNLSLMLSARFEQLGDIADMESNGMPDLSEVIELNLVLLDLRPEGHPERSAVLSNLAAALSARFRLFSDMVDLARAIELGREALDLRPQEHPDHSMALNNLSVTLFSRFNETGIKADLDEVIDLNRTALEFCPRGYPHQFMSLNNIALALSLRFKQFGDRADVDEAVKLNRAALVLAPQEHHDRAPSPNNLALALSARFQYIGDNADLEEAAEYNRAALALYPHGHPGRSKSLSNFALALSTRFEQLGDTADLDKAIELNQSSLNLCPAQGYSERSMSMANLANTLVMQFKQLGDKTDLEQAIQLGRAALGLRPQGHPERSTSLACLAVALSQRFKELGHSTDLSEAIVLNRAALKLHPKEHPDRPATLNNLGFALFVRFGLLADRPDLDEAIELHREALDLCPQRHPVRSPLLIVLTACLATRFSQFSDRADLDQAIKYGHAALGATAPGHPILLHVHLTLVATSFLRYSILKHSDDLNAAFHHHKLAATHNSVGSWQQLESSLTWVRDAEVLDHVSALDAYRIYLGNLDRHATSLSSIGSRHELIKGVPAFIAANAAACAARRNNHITAVELLELGRGLIWTQKANFRTPLERLREVNRLGERLAVDFQRLSSLLDKSCGNIKAGATSLPHEEARHRRLANEWDSIVHQIRLVDGFSRFLLPPSYPDLQEASIKGPVIVINAGKHSCDAFIILPVGPPCRVLLPHVTLDDVSQLSSSFARAVKSPHPPGEENKRRNRLYTLLRQLWDLVARPIVQALHNIHVATGSRIWLCPTSKFTSLPLHAAAPFRKGELGLSDLYIVSYTPTLSALIRSRRDTGTTNTTLKFAAIGQAIPGSGSHESELLAVNAELDLVLDLLPPIPSTRICDTAATSNAVLNALREHSWVHFACHGKQDASHAFDSSFAMYDGPLSLLDIIGADIGHPEFAFLSACHTAVGDEGTPDEIIHLAAGVQFSGFKSVIGTMWAVDDEITHHMVSAFYKNMVTYGMDYTKAAEALHNARQMVDKTVVPLEQRLVFVHIGA